MRWPEWFFVQLNGTPIGMLLLSVGAILTTWGGSLLRYGYAHRWHIANDPYPAWRWSRPRWLRRAIDAGLRAVARWIRRFAPPTFEWNLGMFLSGDSIVWYLLGIAAIGSEDGVDLWLVLLFGAISIFGVRAFYYWAKDRRPERMR